MTHYPDSGTVQITSNQSGVDGSIGVSLLPTRTSSLVHLITLYDRAQ